MSIPPKVTQKLVISQGRKWSKKDSKLKPFGFCCSLDRFDPVSRYDQQRPPYKSSLMAITSVHECPVSKMQMKFFTPCFTREKKKLKASEAGDQQRSKNGKLNYLRLLGRKDCSIKWYLEDEIALAKDIFWMEKQRIYNEASDKAMSIVEKKLKNEMKTLLNRKYPRWYQDFSLDQIKNLKNLENVMRTDYEETKTDGTRKTLIAIGIISTFFKLKPNIINELHKSCNLNSVDFLRKIYKLLTRSDFYKEEYKKFYDCNERIILSAIAFLTLPETVNELHKRLPAIIMSSLPPKPKPPIPLTRQKSSCPYKEELFKCLDWAGYRNALQKWQKQYKLFRTIPTVPKIILLFKQHNQFYINDKTLSEIRKQKKDIYINYLEKTSTKDLQKSSSSKYDAKDIVNIDEEIIYGAKDFPTQENFKAEKSTTSSSYRMLDDDKKFDFTISRLTEKPGTMEYKICDAPKPPRTNQKSWLGEKSAHYIIAGATSQDENLPNCPYEITGMTNVTPSNSDEKFFAMLKLDDRPKKIYPSGRENLSRKWQDWLRNVDENFEQMEEEADELIKSMQTTIKLAFPEPVCDSCCSCRQTRKTDEKLQQSKAPIDNSEKNKNAVGFMTMHSPEPTTGSPINLIASQNEIKTNIIINGITKENGQTRYYISGVQRDNIHIPSRILDSPASPLVKNVPPCTCAIQQMINKDVSPSISEDDIPWTKDEGMCIGKKYRPNESGAYSCKTYPDDQSCRRNPFMKEVIRMERNKKEKEKREREKEKAEPIEEIKKEIQTSTKKIIEKKKDKFIPNSDYPAYDDYWNILRTAPSKIIETDYEKTLKLTTPVFPTISSSLNMQKKQENISFSQELKKVEKNILNKENNEKISEISLKLSKRIKKEKSKDKEKLEDMEKKKRKEWIPSKNIIVNKKGTNLSSKIFKSIYGTKKNQRTKLSLSSFRRPVKQSDRVNKLTKYSSTKKDRETVMDEDKLNNRKREMAKIKNMFKSFAILDDIQPAILPKELLAISQRDPEKIIVDSPVNEEESRAISKAPCGWRTKSEQELPAKKTLTYLYEPDYPLETVAVRPGGRPCQCRENRSKKKILMYNMGGLVEKKRDERRVRKTKVEEENRIIDGVLYFTPPISPRRSNEYIPEYDLSESPYDMCINHVTDKTLKLIEKYSGPKSLVEKIQKKSKLCSCNNVREENHFVDQKKDIAETRRKLMESKLPEERWKTALKDAALMDYFTQRKNNIPCWTSCKKFAQSARPRKLKVVKPVCECKYERKIVERNEERTKWKTRQGKLKALEKQPFMQIVDISRPMIEDTKFIISDVKTMPLEDEHKKDIKYCISDVAKNISMLPPQQVIDGLKMSTPFQTPQPSREHILRAHILHRHWSPTNIPPGPLPRKDAALKKEMERRKNARDEVFEDKSKQDASCLHPNYQEISDKKKLMTCHETNLSQMDVEKKRSKKIIGLQSPSKKIGNKIEYRKDKSHQKIASEVFHKKEKYLEETTNEIVQQDVLYKQTIDKIGKKIDDERHLISDGDDEKRIDSKLNLMAIIKAELKKMAAEGYIFAKLPKCYLMPQFQDWIMYRQCVTFTETDKKNLMRATVRAWHLLETARMPKIEKPSLHMTKCQLKKLTYNQAEEIKEKIQEARAIFHSKVRKARVSYARTIWDTMESGKFPSTSFKRIFFTYMASKESDGYVYKPWLPSEVQDLTCY
ncbi:uncharacterized protein [Polyergus mexicanus]|uniref:uncharacterized protein n=1 Tax=Polyergus mexicanus TaxID=615972 RepID=UPI0038B5B914